MARKVLRPKDIFDINDKRIGTLAFFRSLFGLLTVVVATVRFRGPAGVAADDILHIAEVLAVGVISVLGCIVLFLIVPPSRGRLPFSRGKLLRRIGRPLSKMVFTFGSMVGAVALGGSSTVTRVLNTKHPTVRALFLDSTAGWHVVLTFWLLLFALWAVYYAARYLYCAGEVHPLLAPLVTIVAVTLIIAIDTARVNGWLVGFEPVFRKVIGEETGPLLLNPAPPGLVLVLAFGGWLTTTGLAVWEWERIRVWLRQQEDSKDPVIEGYSRG
jgi:hypothetical protein